MRCDAVAAILAGGDGRVARRRDVRAHLRDCADCRAFAAEARSRGETLAAIAPLPAVAAAALVKSALAASAGGAAAGGGATGAGGAGLAAGTAAKFGSTAALLKSAAGVAAIVAVGVVGADRTHLVVHLGGSGDQPAAAKAARAAPRIGQDQRSSDVSSGADPGAAPANATAARARGTDQGALLDARRASGHRATGNALSTKTQDATDRSGSDLVDAPTATGPGKSNADNGRRARGADHSASAAGTVHPVHPGHPADLSHPTHPGHPAHPEQSARTAPPVSPAHPEHPAHPSTPAPVEATTTAPAAVPEASPIEAAPGQANKEARQAEAES